MCSSSADLGLLFTTAFYYLGTNLALGATITHCFLWYWADVKKAFQQFRTRSIDDAHYAVMAKNYKEVPMWVYGAIVLVSFAIAQATCCKESPGSLIGSCRSGRR